MAGAVPAYDYQQLAQALIAQAQAQAQAVGVAPGAGAANAGSTAHYSGDHMDIERVETSMKKFLSDICVDTNATVLQNIRTFLDHVSNVFIQGRPAKLFYIGLETTWSESLPMLWTPTPPPTL